MLWQPLASQDAFVVGWSRGLPLAMTPLWHVAQVPGAIPVWVNVAGSQAVVRWQASQDCVVGTWFVGLPRAVVPL